MAFFNLVYDGGAFTHQQVSSFFFLGFEIFAHGILILVLLLAAAGTAGGSYVHGRQAAKEADRVMEQMQAIVPGLGSETGSSAGAGSGPLTQMNIEGHDVVGCLAIPALDRTIPVTAAKREAGFATVVSGSPAAGQLILRGNRRDAFRGLTKLDPGDKISFTDLAGNRTDYEVITQFHLKEWDEADYDLLLTYKAGPKTDFVVGCKRI